MKGTRKQWALSARHCLLFFSFSVGVSFRFFSIRHSHSDPPLGAVPCNLNANSSKPQIFFYSSTDTAQHQTWGFAFLREFTEIFLESEAPSVYVSVCASYSACTLTLLFVFDPFSYWKFVRFHLYTCRFSSVRSRFLSQMEKITSKSLLNLLPITQLVNPQIF